MGVTDRQKLLSLVVILTLVSVVQGGFGFNFPDSSFPLPSELQCEGYPIVMRCPGTDVIQVVSAEYGRTNRETCVTVAEKTQNVNCSLPQAYAITSAKCNNKTQCKLPITSENFYPDPCPDTHKYLQVRYKCVKYMFGCPGTLIGIGINKTFDVAMRPESGSWFKDPIYNPGHVFYISRSQRFVQEFRNISAFVNGDEANRLHTLPSSLEGTSYVIYDGFMYYIKARTRIIIKYSFMAGVRVKQGTLTGSYSSGVHPRLSKVYLAVDEQGLWAIYADRPNSDLLAITRINKETLELEQTWKTTYSQSSCLHSFMICGVLYVIGTSSGEVDYVYNTNGVTGKGKYVSIGFDQNRLALNGLFGDRKKSSLSPRRRFDSPAGLRSSSRSFLSYNFTSVMYNPRDRLLYAWEASSSKAVYYYLHFDGSNPAKSTTASTSTTTATTTASTTTNNATTTNNGDSNDDKFCPQVYQSGVQWPLTSVGSYAVATCPSNSKKTARWLCKNYPTTQFDLPVFLPQWDPQGPDMSDCDAWLDGIGANLDKGRVDVITAADQLANRLITTSQRRPLDGGEIEGAANLVRKIVTLARDNELNLNPSQTRQLADNVIESVDELLKPEDAWMMMDSKSRYLSMDDIVTSIEDVGFLLLQAKLSESSQESEVVAGSQLSLYSEMESSFASHFTSPSHLNDQILLPTDDLSLNKDSFFAVFVFYNNVGTFVNAPLDDEDNGEWKVRSKVVSVSIGSSKQHKQLSSPVKITLETTEAENLPRKCVYWKFDERNNDGAWSTDGCIMTSSNASHTECSCNRVTSFAVLVNVVGVSASAEQDAVLNVASIVGISVSLICLLLSIITFSFFRNIQSDRNTIHKHLCICLFAAEAVFLFGINQTSNQLACSVIAGVLHYLFLAAFMWMALEGFQLYVLLIEVFEAKSRWKWYYLVGYGTPLVIVGVSAIVDSSGYGTENACWLKVDSGFIWSFVGPVCAVILFNLVFLGITMAKIYRHSQMHSDASKMQNLKEAVGGASLLVFLLGITWVFGILWISESTLIMAYLFSLFNAFQGLFIFIFHCLLPKKVRSEYSRFFARHSCCEKNSHNSYITNSMSFSKHYPSNSTSGPTNEQSALQRMWDEARGNPHQSAQDFQSINYQQNSRIGSNPGRKNRSSSQLDRSIIVPRSVASSSAHDLHSSQHPSFMGRNDVVEDAYDHLQHHCHHEHSGLVECSHIHHAGTRRGGGDLPRRPLPQQPRSQTMNPLHPARERHQVVERENRILRSQKASTLANMQGHELGREVSYDMEGNQQADPRRENDYLLPIQQVEYSGYNSKMDRNRKPLHSQSSHPNRAPRQRRSMASSGSDDPVVNDYSASSSVGSKPSSLTGTITAKPCITQRNAFQNITPQRWEGGRAPAHFREEDAERDENDLEVELLTEADKCQATKLLHPHSEACDDQQRDSAFYQSMAELDASPMARYSSNSSHCSPDSGNTELHHFRHQRAQRSFDADGKQQSRRQSDTHYAENHNYANHPDQTTHPFTEKNCESPDDLHHRAVMTSSCNYGNRYELHQGLDAPNRMMTCL